MTLCRTTEAAVEGHARRGAWPWETRGVPTSVTAAVGCLTTSHDVPCGDHPPRHAPSGIPIAVPRPIMPHSPGDPPSCPLASDSYGKSLCGAVQARGGSDRDFCLTGPYTRS